MPATNLAADGSLAEGVLNLAQTLTKNNAVLKERTEEKQRLSKIMSEFRKHLSWQSQRTMTLKRNLERLHNETNWLSTKSEDVKQDAQVVAHELRQATTELERLRAARDSQKEELSTLVAEVKLEQDAVSAISAICAQASKALTAHARERDSWKMEADRAEAEARKLKNQLDETAYKVNGLAAGAL